MLGIKNSWRKCVWSRAKSGKHQYFYLISNNAFIIEDQVLLWNEFCPEFPWVGPLWKDESSERKRRSAEETVDQYLGEYWLGADGIQKIHFRQFAWVRFVFQLQTVLYTVNFSYYTYSGVYSATVMVCLTAKSAVPTVLSLIFRLENLIPNFKLLIFRQKAVIQFTIIAL